MTKLATLCLLLAGCVESRIETSETDQEVLVGNGVSLNGVSLNGVSLNGVSLNGVSLNGVSLNGVSLDGVSLDGVSLNGVSLDGISADGTELTLASVGAQLVATLSNGDTIELRIDGATLLTGANSDLWSYAVSYATTLGWQPLCEGDALAVSGTWNTESGVAGGGAYTPSMTSFTFACRGRTIAKCVELGYKTPDLTDELTSCVRLLRGDYCGNGTPYTVDGTTLNLYDNRGVQSDTETWLTEGEWTPDGARCITKDRFARFEQAADTIPSCVSKRVTSSCGNFRNGAVLVSELPVLEQANRESGSTMTLLSRK